MRIHMVSSVRNMLHPERATGFASESIACEVGTMFGPPPARFHTSRPADVSCWKCLRLLAEGRINLIPLTNEERSEYAAEHLAFMTRMALRSEVDRTRELVRA